MLVMLCKSQSCCSAAITLRTPVFSDIRVTSALSIFSMLFLVPVHPDRLARRQLAPRATLGSDVASGSSWGTRTRSCPRRAGGSPVPWEDAGSGVVLGCGAVQEGDIWVFACRSFYY